MKTKAYAKINFGLKVYKGTKESKHKIDSIFYLYKNLYNIVKIKKSNQIIIEYDYRNIRKPKHNENLVYKALKYLEKKYGWDVNYKISIKKNIPLGSGLGGSSSDAAAVINFVVSQNDYQILDLEDIALKVGSDIPFFLTHYPVARVREYGNLVSPIYHWDPELKLTINDFDCDTKEIFTALENDKDYVSKVSIEKILSSYLYKQHMNVVYNDLTKYIIQDNSELAKLYKSFDSHSFFSGAGSTIITIKE